MESLERLDRETSRAYQAFLDYARLGPDRSHSKLLRLYENNEETIPTSSVSSVKTWSTDNDWVERALRYDEECQTELERGIRKRRLRLLDAFGELVLEAIAEAEASGASLSQVAGAVRAYLDGSLAVSDEMPTRRLEVKNTTEMSEDELKDEAARLVRRMQRESQIAHVLDVPTATEGKGD